MTNQLRKTAYRFALGAMLVSFSVASCNDSKTKETKEVTDTTSTKIDNTTPPPPPMDTTMTGDTTMKKDTADTRPVKPGD